MTRSNHRSSSTDPASGLLSVGNTAPPSGNASRGRPPTAAKGSPATRLTILEAAASVLETKGVFDATVADVVRQAGIAQGTFYIYFEDKFALFKELCALTIERLFERAHLSLDQGASTLGRIQESIEVIFGAWEEHAVLLRSLYQLASVRPDFKQFQVALGQPFKERMYREISSSVARGRARPVDARVASEALSTLVSAMCMNWFGLNLPPYPGAEIADVSSQLALLWYRALYAADPPGAHAFA